MPTWTKAECNNCDFSMPLYPSSKSYIIDDNGEKILLRHPGENATIKRVLGDDYSIELLRERIRHISWIICLDCFHRFDLDMKEEELICPECNSNNIKASYQLIGEECPHCKIGAIEEHDTGIIS